MGRPRASNPKSVELGVCFDVELATRLQLYCDRYSISKAEAIRRSVKKLLKEDGETDGKQTVSKT